MTEPNAMQTTAVLENKTAKKLKIIIHIGYTCFPRLGIMMEER